MIKRVNNIYDAKGIQLALQQADKAFHQNEVPVGAVLLDEQGSVIAQGYNQVEKKQTQLAHAELQVLHKASKKIQAWRLSDCTLYVTLQPCMMCLGALILSRVSRIVYMAHSPLFGCDLDKYEWFGIYKDSLPSIEFCEQQKAVLMLKKFFKKQRSLKHDSSKSVR